MLHRRAVMREFWGVLLFTALFAGGAFSQTTLLNKITHTARYHTNVTITLSRQEYSEQCYLITPQGNNINLNTAGMNGVTAFPIRTNFVSCRVVIGPMEQGLLGTWTLCGSRTVDGSTLERCQAANIQWSTNPAEEWTSANKPNIDYPLHNGVSLSPVVRGGGGLQTCHVITPGDEDIVLTADSDYPGLQQVLFDDDVRACGVNIGPLNVNFLGSWVLYGTFNSHSIGFNVATQPFTISLHGGTEENNDGTLPTISHGARIGTRITITLSRKDYIEQCSLRTPIGNTVQLQNAQINGVQVFATRTNFVSCRVVIGPMAEDLLGTWTLCGKHTEGGNTQERCQPANITWATNQAEEWTSSNKSNIDYPFHNGVSLSPVVRGGGGLQTCHVITPGDEDIVLTADSDYPGLQRVLFDDDVRACGVNIGPLNVNFLGSWVLYGTFNSRSIGFNVATQPFTISLHGGTEENNDGTLPTISHGAKIGTRITITLSRKDYTEECSLRTPIGNTVQLQNAQINGVQVFATRTNFVSCRVVIGPMAEDLLGTWTLCGKHTEGGNTQERCQPANITWATNQAEEWTSSNKSNIDYPFHDGVSLSPVVRGGGGLQTCHVITPGDEDIVLTADSDYPGLQRVLFDDDVRACGVNIGPLNVNFLGSWVLYGTFNSRSIGFNVATQPFTISLHGGTEENNDGTLPTISHGARIGTRITITLSRKDYTEECSLRTPIGNTVQLQNAQINGVQVFATRTNFVSCRVVIGPMAEDLLGTWTLCGKHTEGGNTQERCQPANITWATNQAEEWTSSNKSNIDYPFHDGVSLSPVVRGGGGLQTCHVITPGDEDIVLTADSDYPGLQRVLFDDDVRACGVNIGPLNVNFLGSWVLYGTFNSRSIGFNVATQPFTISLHGGTEENNDGTLPTISHGARIGTRITITLSRKDYTEECSLRTPIGNTVQLQNAQINGVQVFATRTNFVSCRVGIGPMAEDLLGTWTLCGKHTEGGNTQERCQPANITWATNQAEEWTSSNKSNIDYPFHDGVSLSPVVRGGGGLQTCHVITPGDEDIVLTADSDYPGLQRVLFDDDVRACGVNIGPLNVNFLGSWVLYGTFNSRSIGFNVATQPFTISLHGGTEENNDGTLPTISHGARIGTRITITLSRKDYTEECSLRTPIGNTVQLQNAQINGVQVFATRTNFVSCRVVIGPMAEDLLGTWTLCGKHTEGGNTQERCQPANITWATNNPAVEWISRTEPNIDLPIHDGFSLSPTVRGGGGIRSCHVVTPDGEDIALIPESDYPGLRRILSDTNVNVCSVSFGPLNANFQGSWILYGTFNSGSIGFNIATQPLTFTLEGDENQNGRPMMLPTINHGARLGIKITITLSRKDYTEECHLKTPNGEIALLTNTQIDGVQVYGSRTNFVSCRVVIGPLQETLLGTWTLCGKHTVRGNTYERCQPANITWATNNPATEWLSTTNSDVNFAVQLGYSLNHVVRGGGGVRTCHVITPEGEDIALTADSDYPGLRRVVVAEDVSACSVHFGPFDDNFLGRWVLYGTFNSGSIGFNVATQPITFALSGSSTVVIWSSVVAVSLVILIVGLLFGPKRHREWTLQRSSRFRSTIRKKLINDPLELRIGQPSSTSGV